MSDIVEFTLPSHVTALSLFNPRSPQPTHGCRYDDDTGLIHREDGTISRWVRLYEIPDGRINLWTPGINIIRAYNTWVRCNAERHAHWQKLSSLLPYLFSCDGVYALHGIAGCCLYWPKPWSRDGSYTLSCSRPLVEMNAAEDIQRKIGQAMKWFDERASCLGGRSRTARIALAYALTEHVKRVCSLKDDGAIINVAIECGEHVFIAEARRIRGFIDVSFISWPDHTVYTKVAS